MVYELVSRKGKGPYFSGETYDLISSDTILDLGANIGLNVYGMAQSNCRGVIALEPDNATFELLELNTKGNC